MIELKYRIIRPIIHFFIILGIFFLTYKIRLTTDLIPGIQLDIPPINTNNLILFSIIGGLLFIFIGIIKNLYELNKDIQKYFQTFTKVRIYRFISITFIGYFGQGFIFDSGISRFILILTGFLTFFILFFFDQIRNGLLAKKCRNSKNKMLIITNDINSSYEAITKIKKGFSYKSELININEINSLILNKYQIIVAIGNIQKQELQKIFEKIRLSDTRFYHISEGYFLEDIVYTTENIDNIIVIEYKHSKLDGRSKIFKRIFDFFVSIFSFLILLPFMIIIGIIIKISSPGPIIYQSKRIGKGGKEFKMYKFRTMIKNADLLKNKLSQINQRQGPLFKIKNDPRITKIGRFLRKTSIDELPQLINVIKGNMSLVGPRPHLPKEVKKYTHRQKRLLSIKPGITGYAQIFGRDNLDFDDEARLDLYYIRNWSIFLDLYIIFGTFGVVFKGK